MKDRKRIRQNIKIYDRKRSNLEKRLEQEFLDHGIATIPCNVGGMDDIISGYSVEGYESLDSGFVEYINDIVDLVPDEYPIVISIVGHNFTAKEQETIRNTIEADFDYDLGHVEKENHHHMKIFWWMLVGLVITGIILMLLDRWDTIPKELLFVFFWFFADTFVDYLLLGGRELRKQRIKAARLACISVIFSEKYNEEDYSEDEAEEIYDSLYSKVDVELQDEKKPINDSQSIRKEKEHVTES